MYPGQTVESNTVIGSSHSQSYPPNPRAHFVHKGIHRARPRRLDDGHGVHRKGVAWSRSAAVLHRSRWNREKPRKEVSLPRTPLLVHRCQAQPCRRMPEAYARPQAQPSRTPQVPGQQADMLLQCRGQTSPVLEDSHSERILLLA